jgi:voltage-gated potassium channel
LPALRQTLAYYYESDEPPAHRFRYALLTFDLVTVLFIVATSFLPRTSMVEWLDLVFGLIILADFTARLTVSRNRARDLAHPATWADAVAIVSFLAPVVGEGAGFLRILRTLRLLHSYQLVSRLRADSPLFRRHEEVLMSVVHLGVFLFVMSAIVYETQHWSNPGISNYVDALYFTVTALLRLVRALLRPHKVRYPCPVCGLQRHEIDAVHCKACGTVLAIPDEGRF